jgi:hypothetical protein
MNDETILPFATGTKPGRNMKTKQRNQRIPEVLWHYTFVTPSSAGMPP